MIFGYLKNMIFSNICKNISLFIVIKKNSNANAINIFKIKKKKKLNFYTYMIYMINDSDLFKLIILKEKKINKIK